MKPTEADRERFDALYRAHVSRVRAYVRRHADPGQVDEIVADTFLTAWRRRDRVDLDDPVPWLLLTARRVAANAHRRRHHRTDVESRLERLVAPEPAVDGIAVDRAAALVALGSLSDAEREALLLVAWDGLDHTRAALVVGCSARAFTVRVHRARQRLARQLEADAEAPGAAHRDPPARPTRPPLHLIEESR